MLAAGRGVVEVLCVPFLGVPEVLSGGTSLVCSDLHIWSLGQQDPVLTPDPSSEVSSKWVLLTGW